MSLPVNLSESLEQIYTHFIDDMCKSSGVPDMAKPLIEGFTNYQNALLEGQMDDRLKRAFLAGMIAATPFISGCAGNHHRSLEEIDADIARLKAKMAAKESTCSRNNPAYKAAKFDYIMNGDRSGLDAYAARCNDGSRDTPEYRAAMYDWIVDGDRSGL